jgi:hypothetical protein
MVVFEVWAMEAVGIGAMASVVATVTVTGAIPWVVAILAVTVEVCVFGDTFVGTVAEVVLGGTGDTTRGGLKVPAGQPATHAAK